MSRRTFMLVFKVALTIGTLFFLADWFIKEELPAWPDHPESFLYISLAVLCVVPALYFRSLKWFWVIQRDVDGIKLSDAFKSYVGAMPLSLITPGRVGEFARLLYLPQIQGSRLRVAWLVMIDKLMDLGGVVLWATLAIPLWLDPLLMVPALFGGLVIITFPLWMTVFDGLAKRILALLGITDFKTLHSFSFSSVLKLIPATLLCFFVEWVQAWLLLSAWQGESVSFLVVIQVMAVVTLANAFQLTLFGIGIREGLAGYLLFEIAGIPKTVGAAIAFLMFVIDQALPSLLGLTFKVPQLTHKEVKLDS